MIGLSLSLSLRLIDSVANANTRFVSTSTMASQNRVAFGTFLAFRVKDAVSTVGSKRPQKELTYYTAHGTRKSMTLHMYTADPEGYDGPDVMECIRPDDPNLKKKKKKKDDREPERSPEPVSPEPLHLYYVVGATGKKLAHIPLGTEADEYLLNFLISTMEEMEENGENVFDAKFNFFVEKVKVSQSGRPSQCRPNHCISTMSSERPAKNLLIFRSATEADEYLLNFLISTMEEMEENGENVFDAPLNSFVEKVNEHFDVLDVETRLEPIWQQCYERNSYLQ